MPSDLLKAPPWGRDRGDPTAPTRTPLLAWTATALLLAPLGLGLAGVHTGNLLQPHTPVDHDVVTAPQVDGVLVERFEGSFPDAPVRAALDVRAP